MKILIVLLSLLVLFSQTSRADNLTIGASKQGDLSTQKPKSGLSMNKVRERYGEPQSVVEAVGEPPITRWHYAQFTVYFEFDKVIHSVLKHSKN